MTEMQRRFSHSKYFRRQFLANLNTEAEPSIYIPGTKQLMNSIFSDVFANKTEADIKHIMFAMLQCVDLTEEQRQEAIYILSAAETAMTRRQKLKLNEYLYY